jgi:hypothetical protein
MFFMTGSMLRFVAVGLTCLVTGCNGCTDYNVKLPNGYELIRTNADTVIIYVPKGGFVIPPKITALNKHQDLVFGKAERSDASDIPCVEGFFFLNTKTGEKHVGMDKAAWLELLRKHGIEKGPTLRKPSRYFR